MILKQTMADVSRGGMDLRASSSDQSWAVIAATRILIDILRGHGPLRASRAAEKAHEFFETSLKRNAMGVKIECAKGCAFCCHVAVSVLAPEVFHIANTLRAQHATDLDSRRAAIRAAAGVTLGVSDAERGRRKLPCALLENNSCSVYSARPGPGASAGAVDQERRRADQRALADDDRREPRIAAVLPHPVRRVVSERVEAQLELRRGHLVAGADAALVVTQRRDPARCEPVGEEFEAVVLAREDARVAIAVRGARAGDDHDERHRRARGGHDQSAV